MAAHDFDQVFTQHVDFAWRALRRHGVAEADLEDACQEVFLAVHRNLASFEGRSTLRTWIYGICRGVAANHRRRAGNRYEIASAQPDDGQRCDALDAFERTARRQGLALLEALLDRLDDAKREAFVLYEIEEMTLAEIAEATRASRTTVHSRLQAARREVAAHLERIRARRRVA